MTFSLSFFLKWDKIFGELSEISGMGKENQGTFFNCILYQPQKITTAVRSLHSINNFYFEACTPRRHESLRLNSDKMYPAF